MASAAAANRPHWDFDAKDEHAAHAARHGIVAHLRECFGPAIDTFAAELVVGELVGNVARYAPGPVSVQIEPIRDGLVLHVIDRGRGFSRSAFSASIPQFAEHGRGLQIVAALTRSLDVECTGQGCHVRAVLPVGRIRGSN